VDWQLVSCVSLHLPGGPVTQSAAAAVQQHWIGTDEAVYYCRGPVYTLRQSNSVAGSICALAAVALCYVVLLARYRHSLLITAFLLCCSCGHLRVTLLHWCSACMWQLQMLSIRYAGVAGGSHSALHVSASPLPFTCFATVTGVTVFNMHCRLFLCVFRHCVCTLAALPGGGIRKRHSLSAAVWLQLQDAVHPQRHAHRLRGCQCAG
jgi:hypothetical protein